MSRSEITVSDLMELHTEMKNTDFSRERGRFFVFGLCNQLYPLVDVKLLNKARPQVISPNFD